MDKQNRHAFYGYEIISREEKEKVEEILKPYQGLAATEELKKKIWDDLQKAKYEGRITIPFKVVSRKDIYKKYPDCIEIILDTKV